MQEEVGLDNLKIIGQTKENVYRYRWKKIWTDESEDPKTKRRYYGYKGQRATVFYLRFSNDNKDIKVDQKELVAWQWVPQSELLKIIHPVRRALAKIILADLKRYKDQPGSVLKIH